MRVVGITWRDAQGRVHTQRMRRAVILAKVVAWPGMVALGGLVAALVADGWVFVGHTGFFWSRILTALFWR